MKGTEDNSNVSLDKVPEPKVPARGKGEDGSSSSNPSHVLHGEPELGMSSTPYPRWPVAPLGKRDARFPAPSPRNVQHHPLFCGSESSKRSRALFEAWAGNIERSSRITKSASANSSSSTPGLTHISAAAAAATPVARELPPPPPPSRRSAPFCRARGSQSPLEPENGWSLGRRSPPAAPCRETGLPRAETPGQGLAHRSPAPSCRASSSAMVIEQARFEDGGSGDTRTTAAAPAASRAPQTPSRGQQARRNPTPEPGRQASQAPGSPSRLGAATTGGEMRLSYCRRLPLCPAYLCRCSFCASSARSQRWVAAPPLRPGMAHPPAAAPVTQPLLPPGRGAALVRRFPACSWEAAAALGSGVRLIAAAPLPVVLWRTEGGARGGGVEAAGRATTSPWILCSGLAPNPVRTREQSEWGGGEAS